MKIAFVDEDLSPRTGSRRFSFEVARQLKAGGHEVEFFTVKLNKKLAFEAYQSLRVHAMSSGSSGSGSTLRRRLRRRGNLFVNVAGDLRFWLSRADIVMDMSRKIAEQDFDVVMLHYHGEHWLSPYFYYLRKSSAVVFMNVARRVRRSWNLPFHEMQQLPLHREIVDKALLLPPVGSWEKVSRKKIRGIIAPSRFLLDQVKEQGLTGQASYFVVPLGVNHSEFRPKDEDEGFALYAGRIHPHKSLELAIMAMRGADSDRSLVIAGDLTQEFLWYKDKLVRLAEEMKVADRVKIIEAPSDSEVVRLMQKCSVFLFPSTVDTFGLVVLEAMACGKPIIACNCGGVPEVVGDAGFLLDPSPQQWQSAVGHVFSDPVFRRKMGEKSLVRSQQFSWEKTTEKLLTSFSCVV